MANTTKQIKAAKKVKVNEPSLTKILTESAIAQREEEKNIVKVKEVSKSLGQVLLELNQKYFVEPQSRTPFERLSLVFQNGWQAQAEEFAEYIMEQQANNIANAMAKEG